MHNDSTSDIRIVSYNVNGIRAAIKKGFMEWLGTHPAEIICLQEPKAQASDIDTAAISALGYEVHWFAAQKKGYSGVVILTKQQAKKVIYGNGYPMSDEEGRVIAVELGSTLVVNAYFPSGTSGDERQTYKYQWLAEMQQWLQQQQQQFATIILCGDYNIAHTPIDIHDPKGNKNSSGFLPEERDWMQQWLQQGWVDSFRCLHPEQTGAYSWWSQRFPSVRLQNKGWRIDYICHTQAAHSQLKAAGIWPDVKHSDHCPIWASYAASLFQ